MTTVQSRAHRILKRLAGYESVNVNGGTYPGVSWTGVADQEELVGIYRNTPSSLEKALLFTRNGIYLRGASGWRRLLAYESLDRIVSPTTKTDVTGLSIQLVDGSSVWLPVRGAKNDRTFDAFEVWRFLLRVKADLERTDGA